MKEQADEKQLLRLMQQLLITIEMSDVKCYNDTIFCLKSLISMYRNIRDNKLYDRDKKVQAVSSRKKIRK